jgi:hypothetical protein
MGDSHQRKVMKKTLILIGILMFAFSLFGKIRVFNDFDFKQGGFQSDTICAVPGALVTH